MTFDLAALRKAVASMPPPLPSVEIVCPTTIDWLEKREAPTTTALGIPIWVCDWLPKTVKDKDGNEVELLGVMVSEPRDPWVAPTYTLMTK